MRIAVCGGPYANPYALRAFLDDARARDCERLFCLGDLGGFGAEMDPLWPLLVEGGVECIAGNYDVAIGRGDTDCGCGYRDPRDNEFAQIVYDCTRDRTSPEFAAWMHRLPTERRETIGGCDVHMVHGSPLAINDFFWESMDEEQAALRVRASGADVLLCTHTSLPWQRRIRDTLVVNVGAIGKPANDGRRETWYAVLDLADGSASAELVPLAYDWRAQAASMRAAGLPEAFAETIETGWWTTCLEVVPPRERARGRFHLYRSTLPERFSPEAAGWADPPEPVDDGRPVVPLFGTGFFPPRLWIYTNFHCNLACDYCAVASSPHARPRNMPLPRFRALVNEAVDEGFTEIYLTGGEPFVHPDIVDMALYASERLPTVVLTNVMLFRGQRLEQVRRLAGRPGLVLQTSVDGARAATHDSHRGAGSWARTMEGIATATELRLPLRVAMTETEENAGEGEEVAELLAELGVAADDFAVRPLVRRGFSDAGLEITDASMVPELTVTMDGLHWHPAAADAETSPDMVLATGSPSLGEGKRLVTERFLTLRHADGSLPQAYRCAV